MKFTKIFVTFIASAALASAIAVPSDPIDVECSAEKPVAQCCSDVKPADSINLGDLSGVITSNPLLALLPINLILNLLNLGKLVGVGCLPLASNCSNKKICCKNGAKNLSGLINVDLSCSQIL